MMKYYGDKTCAPCRETKLMLDKYGIPVEFIDVEGNPEYKDKTPQLELDDGTLLIGKEAIMHWLDVVD
jgi:glutathione S-transferase